MCLQARASARARVRLRACVHACACVRVFACVCVCVYPCVSVRACARARAYACVGVLVHVSCARVRECVRACVQACMCACVRARLETGRNPSASLRIPPAARATRRSRTHLTPLPPIRMQGTVGMVAFRYTRERKGNGRHWKPASNTGTSRAMGAPTRFSWLARKGRVGLFAWID